MSRRSAPVRGSGGPLWRRVDLKSLAVLPAGLLIVLLVQVLEGGSARSLLQGPAALIVFGGTLAALLVSYSFDHVHRALREAADSFAPPEEDEAELASRFVGYAALAHRRGLLALEEELDLVQDPFLRSGLTLVIDGASPAQLQDVLAASRMASDLDEAGAVRVFEAAAGYAPTLGILGAVMGLIQVMEHLGQPGALGSGIAVAFVATLYGVGAANLLFLPLAARLRERSTQADRRRALIAEGLAALNERTHPRLVAHRLRGFAGLRFDAASMAAGAGPTSIPA